jgi:SET domain-containing protein
MSARIMSARTMSARVVSARIVRVGRAATGLGLFAVRPVAAGAYIATYRGKRIPTVEAHRREQRSGAKYMFEVNRRWSIDGSSRRNLGRYINHACRPNAEAVLRAGRIVFVALRDIAPGEEITLDYGEDYFDLFIKPSGCRCAACVVP